MNQPTPSQWQVLKPILDKIHELPSAEKPGRLAEDLKENPELLQVALTFLDLDNSLFERLAQPIVSRDLFLSGRPDTVQPLQTVGPYQLLEQIGMGGMGVVYKARKTSEGLDKVVALKLLRPGMNHQSVVQRFLEERRILAGLNHPYIAKFLDGGHSEDQRPYVVLEFIEGQPLMEYCQTQALGLSAKLSLFQKICGAVHYAHQNLVIHRDLKPGNILVTANGDPCLLDFGIAKLVQSPDHASPGLTEQGCWVMTPEYASPEQFSGGVVTTASDIYCLGVLLYELLAGVRPYERQGRSVEALRQCVDAGDWQKPSANVLKQSKTFPGDDRMRAARLKTARTLRGDLDTMVMKAMSRDPERRYQSAAELSDDIDRYLAGRTLKARPETLRYVVAKFVKRNSLVVSFSTGLIAVIVAFGVVSLRQNQQLQATLKTMEVAQAQTLQERQRAEHVSQFLTNLFIAADPYENDLDQITPKHLLERGAESIAQDHGMDPAVRAALQETMGNIFVHFGLLTNAQPLLTQALQYRESQSSTAPEAMGSIHLAMGHFHYQSGDYTKARDAFVQAASAMDAGGISGEPRAEVAGRLGTIAMSLGDYQESIRLHELARTFLDAEPELSVPAMAIHLSQLSDTYYRLGEYQKAADLLEEALAGFSDQPRWQVQKAQVQDALGVVYRKQGRLREAETLFLEVAHLREQVFGFDSLWVADSYNRLGWLHLRMGRYTKAKELFLKVFEIRSQKLVPDHNQVATVKNSLAGAHLMTGSFEEAERIYLEALRVREDQLGLCHTKYAEILSNLGQVHLQTKQWDRAEHYLGEAYAIRQFLFKPDHEEIARVAYHLGELALLRGQFTLAHDYFLAALQVFVQDYGLRHMTVGCTLGKLGEIALARKDLASAETLLGEALALLLESVGQEHSFTAEVELSISKLLKAKGDFSLARDWAESAEFQMAASIGREHPLYREAFQHLRSLANLDSTKTSK